MTTTPGYTVAGVLQLAGTLCTEANGKDIWHELSDIEKAEWLLIANARAVELTQVTAQSVKRASPAKDGGEIVDDGREIHPAVATLVHEFLQDDDAQDGGEQHILQIPNPVPSIPSREAVEDEAGFHERHGRPNRTAIMLRDLRAEVERLTGERDRAGSGYMKTATDLACIGDLVMHGIESAQAAALEKVRDCVTEAIALRVNANPRKDDPYLPKWYAALAQSASQMDARAKDT